MKKLIIILLIFCSSCANYKYNRGVTERNKITTSMVEPEIPYKEKTPVWDYLAVSGLFILMVFQIKNF